MKTRCESSGSEYIKNFRWCRLEDQDWSDSHTRNQPAKHHADCQSCKQTVWTLKVWRAVCLKQFFDSRP